MQLEGFSMFLFTSESVNITIIYVCHFMVIVIISHKEFVE